MVRRNGFLVRFTALLAVLLFLFVLQACGSPDAPPGVEGPPPVEDPPPGGDGPPPAEDDDPPPPERSEPLNVESSLPSDGGGEPGVEYSFTFVYEDPALVGASVALQAVGDEVIFRWTFGDGVGTGDAAVLVGEDGRALYEVSYSYANDGRYGLVLTVEDSNGELLAKKDFIVEIGEVRRLMVRTKPCHERWQGFEVGFGYGVTLYEWHISDWPTGSVIDFKYDAYNIPDKFIVEYPEGVVVVDTGWRGNSKYEGDPLFPGGIAGGGEGEVLEIATKLEGHDSLYFTVIGPNPDTEWEYWARCTPPG